MLLYVYRNRIDWTVGDGQPGAATSTFTPPDQGRLSCLDFQTRHKRASNLVPDETKTFALVSGITELENELVE